jgi:hypothetical protein
MRLPNRLDNPIMTASSIPAIHKRGKNMGDKSAELVHVMPLSTRVKFNLTRVGMNRIGGNKTEFIYQIDNWPDGKGKAPTFSVVIDDWDDDSPAHAPANRRKIYETTSKALNTDLMAVVVEKLKKS